MHTDALFFRRRTPCPCPQVGVIITATCLFWLILLPVNLASAESGRFENTRARFEEWRTRTRSRWQRLLIPASLVHDLLLGVLVRKGGSAAIFYSQESLLQS